MNSLFERIVDMSFTASYVILAVLVIRLLLKKAPKIFSYALWAVVLFRLICPYTFESPLSLLPSKPQTLSYNAASFGESPAVPFNAGALNAKALNAKALNAGALNHLEEQLASPVLGETSSERSITAKDRAVEAGAGIWMLGVLAILLYTVVSYWRLKHRLSTATLVLDDVFETDRIGSPFVLGFVKPSIYIPLNLSCKELDYILKHEKTHIRRRDYLVKPLAFLVLTLHWFNPLVWLSYFLMVKDMEMSCDESVMKQCKEDIRTCYSESLLNFSLNQRGQLTALAFGESSIKSRIKNVLNYKKPRFWIVIVAVITVIGAIAVFMGNPVGGTVFENERYGFAVTLPKAFAEEITIVEEENLIYFTHKEIQKAYSNGPVGVVGRIEIYDKTETTANSIKELEDMYNLRYLGENEKYYFGFSHPTDVQLPAGVSAHLRERYEAAVNQFDKAIKTFKIKNGFNKDIVRVVEGFGNRLQMVPLSGEESDVAQSMHEQYEEFVSPALIAKWLENPSKAPGRITSSPWPEHIDILSMSLLEQDQYEVAGNIIEITSVEKITGGVAATQAIRLVVSRLDGRWMITELTLGEYEVKKPSVQQYHYSLVFGGNVISLKTRDIDRIYDVLGSPISEATEHLGEEADTFAGSSIKTLEYEGLTFKLFAPRGEEPSYWLMSIDSTGAGVETTRGIQIGSAFEELNKAYNNLEEVPDGNTEKRRFRISNQSEYEYMEFEILDGMVVRIRLYVELP